MSGLGGVRVLELGDMASAAYAAKLMADVGADVVKVEEPKGDAARTRGPFPGGAPDPERSGLFLYLNTNKRSLVIDLTSVEGRLLLQQLVSWADILVHNYPPTEMHRLGIDYTVFRRLNTALVMCSITPFGLTGAHRNYRAYEITLAHGGGWAWLNPGGSDRAGLPPLTVFGQQTSFQAGAAAAVAVLAAHCAARETGCGEHIDLSVQAFVASFLELNLVHYTYEGLVASRLGQRISYPWGIYPCKDGFIHLVISEEEQWERLVELMGQPEWARWDIFADAAGRAAAWDVMKPLLEDWTSRWNAEDLFRAGQERRVCFAPVFTMADIGRQRSLQESGFFVQTSHPRAGRITLPGAPYRLRERWWGIRRPAPLRGEHNGEIVGELSKAARPVAQPRRKGRLGLPLEGVRVADFGWVWAGPFCTLHLAHLGAEVIKIESQARPDITRRLRLYPKGMEPGLNRCGVFNQWNQGKLSMLLNLAKPEAAEIARRLVAKCDVVVDNFAAHVMEDLGLGYERLRELKPDIIVASITGFGHSGPYRDYMAYGSAAAPLSGLASLTGYAGGPPEELGISYGDPTAGIHAAVAVCAALVARCLTGRGQYIDVSMWEATTALAAEGWMDHAMNGVQPPRMGDRDPQMSPHNCFPCAGEDQWVTIACGSDEEWARLSSVMGRPELSTDPRFPDARSRKANEDELEAIIADWTRGRDRWDVTRVLQQVGVAAFPSMSSRDLVEDGQLNERGFFVRLPHQEVGVQTHAGIPWLLARRPNQVRTTAPLLGEHTDRVMRQLLGYSDAEIARLKAARVLY